MAHNYPVLPQAGVVHHRLPYSGRRGASNPFFDITAVATVLCIILAAKGREQPLGRSLNYWDEAVVFGFLAQLG
jgi:hypothetical protein